MDFKTLKIKKRNGNGGQNYESFLLRYNSFKGDTLAHRALHFAMAGFYLCKETRDIFAKCAFCNVELLSPETVENAFIVHFNRNPGCTHIQRIAQMCFDVDRKRNAEPWYEEMQSVNYLSQYFSMDAVATWDSDDFLDHLLLAQDKPSGGPICTECKRRRVQVMYIPCGHFISCRICADLAESCEKCKSVIKECWYPKMESDIEAIKEEESEEE